MTRASVVACASMVGLGAIAPAVGTASGTKEIVYPMDAAHWEGEKVEFGQREGFPGGLMTVTDGFSVLKGADFGEGVVEFDMKPLEFSDTGILIHRRDADTAEFIYVRADPECPAANDCVQYAPITNGRMQWNIYPQYQSGAPISPKGWNHLRLVVGGGRLRLFVNREATPSLDVPNLRGLADAGGFAVKGPAVFANLVVSPGATDGAAPPPPQTTAPGAIERWLVAVSGIPVDRGPMAADAPTAGWRQLQVERNGLANLSRAMPHDVGTALSLGWLKVDVEADAAGPRSLELGFSGHCWFFLNGRQVYAGENFYYPGDRRLSPDGRIAPDNALVRVDLRKGRNELLVALDNAWRSSKGPIRPTPYGWAGMVRFVDPTGLRMRP